MTIPKEYRSIITVLLNMCAILAALLIFGVVGHALCDEEADDTQPWAIADEADYPMLLNKATGATWVRACPGAASSCKWVPMRRESDYMVGEEP